MDYSYRQDFWSPEPGSYEATPEFWELFQQQQVEDIRELRESYPELSAWGDLQLWCAWGEYSKDVDFNAWSDPYRTGGFLAYLRLTQEGRLPDWRESQDAIYEAVEREPWPFY